MCGLDVDKGSDARRRGFRSHPQRGGFTLIEVLVAGIILAMAIGVMGMALSRSYGALSDARDERRAAALLNELLTKVDLIGPERIASEGPRSGNFEDEDERFSWTIDVANRPDGHLYQVTATIKWSQGKQELSREVQTYLNDPPKSHDPAVKWRDL